MQSSEMDIGAAFASLYDLEQSSLQFIHTGESLVFEASRGRQPFILKVTPCDQERSIWMASILHWIHYLRENEVLTPNLVLSSSGRWLETLILDGQVYTAYVYHRMPITEENRINWQDAHMPALVGETMGKMHRLARAYQPPPGGSSVGEGEPLWLRQPEAVLHPSQSALFEPIANLRQGLSLFPKTMHNSGMIHDDFHTGNIFYIENQIAVLDFGCCHRSWFAQDIASALLFRVWIAPGKEALVDQAVDFLKNFITGYRRQAEFQPAWLAMFPALLKLRELSLYQSYSEVDLAKAGDDRLLKYLFTSIRDNLPFLPINFAGLVNDL